MEEKNSVEYLSMFFHRYLICRDSDNYVLRFFRTNITRISFDLSIYNRIFAYCNIDPVV